MSIVAPNNTIQGRRNLERLLFAPTEDSMPQFSPALQSLVGPGILQEELAYCNENAFTYLIKRYQVIIISFALASANICISPGTYFC
jgi:hypothetical protein